MILLIIRQEHTLLLLWTGAIIICIIKWWLHHHIIIIVIIMITTIIKPIIIIIIPSILLLTLCSFHLPRTKTHHRIPHHLIIIITITISLLWLTYSINLHPLKWVIILWPFILYRIHPPSIIIHTVRVMNGYCYLLLSHVPILWQVHILWSVWY